MPLCAEESQRFGSQEQVYVKNMLTDSGVVGILGGTRVSRELCHDDEKYQYDPASTV